MSDDDFYDEFEGRGGGEDREKHPAWTWEPDGRPVDVGTVFAGTILDRFKFEDKKKVKRMAFVVATAAGTFVLFVSQWRLEKALAELRPEVGQTLKIRYDGVDPEDRQSKRFTAKVEGTPAPAAPDATPEPAPVGEEFSEEPF